MIDTKCAICENNKNTNVLYKERVNIKKFNSRIFSARRTPDRIHYRFLKCETCGLIFSNPIMPKNKITLLYSESDFTYADEAEYLKKTYFSYFKENVLNSIPKNIKVLEIGCGNGFFLEELRDNGIKNVYGIEPGSASVKKARWDIKKNIKINILKKGLFPRNSFDVICCFHTLDHIINPNDFLDEIYSLLKKSGKAFFIVHNTDALSAKLLGEKSPIFDIEHIYLFNKDTLRKIFLKHGFKKIRTFNVKNKYLISYWFKLLPIPSSTKKFILEMFGNNLGKIPLTFSAGNIGIVAEGKKSSQV